MPKKRKEAGTRKVEKKIYILCEGADKHSEYAYLGALIKDTPIKGDKVQIELAPTKYNTGRELVEEASKKFDKKFKNIDVAWVVYDKDGYSLHKTNGFDKSRPIIVTEAYIIVDGHSRFMAAKKAGLEKVPVIIKKFDSRDETIEYEYKMQLNSRRLTDGEYFAAFLNLD